MSWFPWRPGVSFVSSLSLSRISSSYTSRYRFQLCKVTIWVKWRVSYKKQELPTLREHLGTPLFIFLLHFCGIHVAHLIYPSGFSNVYLLKVKINTYYPIPSIGWGKCCCNIYFPFSISVFCVVKFMSSVQHGINRSPWTATYIGDRITGLILKQRYWTLILYWASDSSQYTCFKGRGWLYILS